MSKAKNRNAERVRNGKKPRPNISGRSSKKPFIGNNVFTKEDEYIVQSILQSDPDGWTLQEIKDALPYAHTTKNIENFLLRMCSQSEIDRHMALPPKERPETDAKKPEDGTNKVPDWNNAMEQLVRTYYPVLGPNYTRWRSLAKTEYGIDTTKRMVIDFADGIGVTHVPDAWTDADDELLAECGTDILNDDKPDHYVYTVFDTPHARCNVVKHILELDKKSRQQARQETAAQRPAKTETTAKRKETTTMDEDNRKRDDVATFAQLSTLLMSLPEDVAMHVDITFPNGLSIRFDRDAKGDE